MMIGLDGIDDGHTRPMTANLDGPHGPIWFFTSTNVPLARDLGNGRRAIATFASRGHDVFASVHGSIRVDNNRRAIDRFWRLEVAAWYGELGKDDPSLALLRFDAERAQIWRDGRSFIAGIRLLFGSDPKLALGQECAKVELS